MSEIIDDVLAGLATARQSMIKQGNKIGEIMERSNNTLLQIEEQASMTPPLKENVESENLYDFSADCELSLIKILEQFQQLMQKIVNEDNSDNQNALDCYLATRQRVENLRSSSRKLVALHDAIAQLKLNVQEQQEVIKEENMESDCDN
ncbi:augmin complex subunit msd1 [Drosophila hydei]|uniref:Augmin complex subunit msd1 n=1 Tax=Drosophila hydei TaxID=7224 RepID=A0A6J1LF45_DROHY|nr:augmin complex subunit msd1 [Drosophila hydei]